MIHLTPEILKGFSNNLLLKRVLWGFIFVGISAAFLQAGLNRSLWLDEGKLATNIITRDFLGLLEPLDSNQVAPIGFLLLQKLLTNLFGNKDFVLRFLPFLAFLLTLLYAFKSSRLLFKSVTVSLLATAILSLNYKLLYYSWEVKQYSLDVFICVLLLYYSLSILNTSTTKKLIVYTIMGVLSIWLSNISVIVLSAFGGYVIYFLAVRKNNFKVLLVGVFWVVSFFPYYFLFIKGHPINKEPTMLNFWEYGFLPLDPFSLEFYSYFAHIAKDICYFIMEGYVFMMIPAIFICIALVKCIRTRFYPLLYILIVPALIHLILSGLHLYPMRDRLILYLLPLFVFSMSYGMLITTRYLFKKYTLNPVIIIVLVMGMIFFSFFKKYPFHVEEVRDSIEYIAKEIQPSETLYVYGSAIDVFNFYSYQNPAFENKNIVRGTYYKATPYKYIPEIESIKGTIWILFAHSFSEDKSFDEKDYILEKLTARGHTIIFEKKYDGSEAVKVQLN
ncbi:glycosyltransferase family 39 protein [Jejudonia soesokkakensis]|uniref:Glycosyltransferase family 39 protein n=1 Tax=Jejudonia soesokkakensis TaxID=1323432 RepID=A0ABW2MVD8_9FLAO